MFMSTGYVLLQPVITTHTVAKCKVQSAGCKQNRSRRSRDMGPARCFGGGAVVFGTSYHSCVPVWGELS